MVPERIERPTQARIEPADSWPEELDRLMMGPHHRRVLNVTRTIARHPDLLARWLPYGGYLAGRGLLAPRTREIVILRVGWRARSVYEFGQHTIYGRAAGLSDEEIRAVTGDPDDWPGAQTERDLLDMVDDLCDDDCVRAQTWERLAARFGPAELVELLLLAGAYRAISGFLNSVGVQPEDGSVPGWPAGAGEPTAAEPRP